MSSLAQTLLLLLAVLAPLALLGRWRVFPASGLVRLGIAASFNALIMVFWADGISWARPGWALWELLAVDGGLLLFALADLATCPRADTFAVERQCGRVGSLAKPHAITLVVSNLSRRGRRLTVRDGLPDDLAADPAEFHLSLSGHSRATLHYTARSSRRGAFVLAAVHLRTRSRWGCWQRLIDYPLASQLHIYPDLVQLEQYAVLARKDRLNLLGVRHARRVGQDNEFERLRDYTPDDNYKHIEWRSTARRGRLTVKDFQQNQSQRVVFLIDCGRMMTGVAAGLTLLDHAFNAMLMLSYVALSRGDSVGMLCFSDEVHNFVPPRGGKRQMNRLLHGAFDRFPRRVESRYDSAFLYLDNHLGRRALVVLVTNLIDEVNAHQVRQYLGNLAGRHLPLGVLLRERRAFEAVEVVSPAGPALFRAAAAAELLSWRRQVIWDLQASGVLVLDVFPEDLTAPLVNRYLEIKARHLL